MLVSLSIAGHFHAIAYEARWNICLLEEQNILLELVES
jgi:hypothetical protein